MEKSLRPLTRPLLWLLFFNLIPQIALRPLWSTVLAFVLVAYRYWLDWTGFRMPPRWVFWGVTFGLIPAIWGHFHTFVGDEAAGTLLTLLACLKIFELNRKRDYFIVAILCFLVCMSYLLADQGLLITGFLIVDSILLVTFLRAVEIEHWDWKSWRKDLKAAGLMTLKALPIMVLTFVLFPRFTTGFNSGFGTNAKTGMSDSLEPGSVSKLVNSDDLIFRATFLSGAMPPRTQLYWRGAVLDVSRGLDWERSKPTEQKLTPQGTPLDPDIEIYLEPGSNRHLFSLDTTRSLAFPNVSSATRTESRDGKIFELLEPLQTRERYYLQNGDQAFENETDFNRYLTTTEKPSPQLQEFLQQYRGKPPGEVVKELMEHFREGGYKYSMQPPPVDNMDEFLFKTKTGFCEHYAGSMATMLRLLGIPSRVAVGFQGGTPSLLDNFISVRGHDAHAWVEYYDKLTNKWHRADPTAEVAPDRLTWGSDLYFARGHSFVPAWMPGDWTKYYFRTRALMDEIEARWTGFLLHFDLARQRELLSKLGVEDVLFRALPVFLVLSLAFVMALMYFFEAQKREPLSRDERLYVEFIKLLRRWKIQRHPNEGPLQLFHRLESAHPARAGAAAGVFRMLVLARYGRQKLSAEMIEKLRTQLRALRRL